MRQDRLRLALKLIEPEQWKQFETLASAFLVPDFPALRTLAGTGDRGRDGEIFQPVGEESVLLQYSISEAWASKVKATARKIREPGGFPNAQQLIYVTSQRIGAAADKLKAEIRTQFGLILDVRDQSWFVDRFALDAQRQAAAEDFAAAIVDPYLATEGGIDTKSPSLSDHEARAACVYLGLQRSDDSRSKGLTKLCFEALVKTSLRGTTSEDRKTRDEIRHWIANVVNHTDRARVDTLTDSALSRLSGKAIRHWKKDDEFCLSQDERSRIHAGLEELELADQELDDALAWEVAITAEALEMPPPPDVRAHATCVKTSIELMLFEKGEAFASAVSHDSQLAPPTDLDQLVTRAITHNGFNGATVERRMATLVEATVRSVLTQPTEPIQRYFRAMADTYTLFAFLRETPDVQSAVKKMFSVGDIWLDTSVVLPLFAETLVEDSGGRHHTTMFHTARRLGLKLYLTAGVLEELVSHMGRSVQCARSNDWVGRIPFLLEAYTLAGNPPGAVDTWLREFRGNQRPADDLAEYLRNEHGILIQSLETEAAEASIELRAAVQEIWHKAHDRRRSTGPGAIDKNTLLKLVSHDVENYLGVIVRRKGEDDSAFGYRAWWLTLDGIAFDVQKKLGEASPASPVMSPDFMTTYLALGPLRGKISAADEGLLPLPTSEFRSAEALPELLEEAKRIREEMEGQSDRVVRREVRDQLDAFRRRKGEHAQGGVAAMQDDLRASLGDASSMET